MAERADMQTLRGLGVSGGIAIGRAVVMETRIMDVIRLPLPEAEVEEEVERFLSAVEQSRLEVERTRDRASEDLGEPMGAIFDAHLLVLCDTGFLDRVAERIREERVNSEWAVYRASEEYAERFAALENEYFRERQADLDDVVHHLIRKLKGISHHDLSEIQGPVVIVADDLTPSEAVRLGREQAVGFALEGGGKTSHTTIIARSLKLPAVAGLGTITDLVTDEDPVIIDGEQGLVILHPTPEVLEMYEDRIRLIEDREVSFLETRELPARTRDGVDIELMANIDLVEELDDVISFGAHGVGLYRSEFLYIEKTPDLPTEDDHVALYRTLAETAAPHPVIIRTYDLGGRKLAAELLEMHEDNPVLGLRGIRLTLARPQIFRTQVRALYRAAVHGDLRIMLPMISEVREVRAFRAFADEVLEELAAEGKVFRRDVPLGVMIEVPSAAMTADILARETDFFSIGTNDLIQYAVAVDRNNEHVADLYQPVHPAILRLLRFVVESANKAEIEVGLCGEMGSDVRYAPLLIGLGLRRLSVTPRAVPTLKTRLGQLSLGDLQSLVARCLELETSADVEEMLGSTLESLLAPPSSGR